jgi:hypothetical protein
MRKRFTSEYEFDRLLDAVMTALAASPQENVLARPPIFSEPLKAANDNHLAWPLIPFPESWFGAC